MKMGKKVVNWMQKIGATTLCALLSNSVFANDLLARALEGPPLRFVLPGATL